MISDVYVEYKDEMDLALKLSEAAKEHFDKIMEMINKVLLENEKLWQRIDRDMKDWNSLE